MKWLRRLAIVAGVLVIAIIVAAGTVYAITERHFNRNWSEVKGKALAVSSD